MQRARAFANQLALPAKGCPRSPEKSVMMRVVIRHHWRWPDIDWPRLHHHRRRLHIDGRGLNHDLRRLLNNHRCRLNDDLRLLNVNWSAHHGRRGVIRRRGLVGVNRRGFQSAGQNGARKHACENLACGGPLTITGLRGLGECESEGEGGDEGSKSFHNWLWFC